MPTHPVRSVPTFADAFAAEREVIVGLLNHALATCVVCFLRWRRHASVSARNGGIRGYATTMELERHAAAASASAKLLTERIGELGGAPEFDPDGLIDRAHASFVSGRSVVDMLAEDVVAELTAVEVYDEMLRYIGDRDAQTHRVLAAIRAQEREHAVQLRDFLEGIGALELGTLRPS